MFKTLTLASIYELQGFKDEALVIYEEILNKDPNNFEAKQAITRLKKTQKSSIQVNQKAKMFFINARNTEELKTFERWLMQWN
ncbi:MULTISPECIES: tetratricopeptide repeat protein [unclassified Helicobacter]|uniref:tetratricopeptide repeat protein n=1 Tax=unclassified Helicobacter TaxID=2593540 RepID=UPI000CF11FC2|nr:MULTISPECIES: tetratricopeptide repeat protein [unclassified Helicobacter]